MSRENDNYKAAEFSLEQIYFEPMQKVHLKQVVAIEKYSFSVPWTEEAFLYDLQENECAHYLTALYNPKKIVAYAGMWVILNEAHIMNIAVHPAFQRRGVGELLMLKIMQMAILFGCEHMTLEVRPSNKVALTLYGKLGFKVFGRRKDYYTNPYEDAIIMWKNNLGSHCIAKDL